MTQDKRILIPVVLGAVLLLAGVAGATDKIGSVTGDPDNPLTAVDRPFTATSTQGNFRVTWPSGCSSLKTRTPADDGLDSDREYPVMVYCDRGGKQGEGCSVTAIFNVQAAGGGPLGPAQVLPRLQNLLQEFGAEVQRQSPVSKDFGGGEQAQGIDVLAAEVGGAGQVWVRGLVIDDVIYILAAWDQGGQLGDNPEYVNFFNSFLPGTE